MGANTLPFSVSAPEILPYKDVFCSGSRGDNFHRNLRSESDRKLPVGGDGGCWFAALSLTRPDKRSCRRRSPLALGPANPRIKKQKQISSRRAIRKTAYETHRPPSPGSKALTNAKREQYCRSRALARSRIQAYREAGWGSRSDNASYVNACRLERRPEIRDRIGYLTRQDEDLIVEKRRRIEEQL
jgi:hypothetical protein